MWSRIIAKSLCYARQSLPPGSRVIEVGYGDGKLSCYLAQELGWRITGYDVLAQARDQAVDYAQQVGVENNVDFHVVSPDETWNLRGEYDGVFIKTVLYNAKSLEEYAAWLDWVGSVLKHQGIFVNYENGKANFLTKLYRRLRRRYYADLCMYDDEIHRLYEERFHLLHVGHYGAVSQFIAPFKWPFLIVANVEERFFIRKAGNSFITALVGRKMD